jgi:hypothetical protein
MTAADGSASGRHFQGAQTWPASNGLPAAGRIVPLNTH